MTGISNLITRARLIKNETEPSANTAERVGQLLEDIINTFASGTPERKTIRQVYDESGKLQVLFACNGSCVLKYSASVSGRSWGDELYYTSTNYPTADTFFTLTRQDFTESRYLGVPRGVCIPTKTVAAAPSIEFTFEVVYLKGSITWYDGDRLVSVSSEDIQCAKIATREDLSSAINLTTSAAGYIYNDQNEPVSSLADNTLYTMNASANGGAFTIPARNDYAGTTIFCYGDGAATLNGTDYAYTSGQTLVLEGGVVHVEDTDNDYYTKAETDAQLESLRDEISTVYKYKGSCLFANLPTTNRKVGDTYNVTDAFTLDGVTYPAGTNVSWTGTEWDALAGDSSNKEDKGNKVTSISSSSTDTQYPSAKCVYTSLAGKADDNAVVKFVKLNGTTHAPVSGVVDLGNTSAEQVQADWNENDSSSKAYIKNKPSVPADSDLVHKAGAETISGKKTFTEDLSVNGATISNAGNIASVSDTTTWRLRRNYTGSARTVNMNVYGSTDGNNTYPRVYAQTVDSSGSEEVFTETTSVALRDDKVSIAYGRTTEWALISASSNLNSDWASKQLPTKNAVSSYVSGQIAGKADDSGVVHTTGAETVGGAKTFSSAVALSASGSIVANNHQAVDGDTVKAYVDSHITDIVITLD